MKLALLYTWQDPVFRSAAANMALDEALFEWTRASGKAVIRFYHWDHPARTRGYLDRGATEEDGAIVRRMTGGGLVEHGEDLTFALMLPATTELAMAHSGMRYQWIHEVLGAAMLASGLEVKLQAPEGQAMRGPCFTNAVPWDLLDPHTGAKIGGGAQRRSHGAVIHQGSLRLPLPHRHPEAEWIGTFLEGLAQDWRQLDPPLRDQVLVESELYLKTRYTHPSWNQA